MQSKNTPFWLTKKAVWIGFVCGMYLSYQIGILTFNLFIHWGVTHFSMGSYDVPQFVNWLLWHLNIPDSPAGFMPWALGAVPAFVMTCVGFSTWHRVVRKFGKDGQRSGSSVNQSNSSPILPSCPRCKNADNTQRVSIRYSQGVASVPGAYGVVESGQAQILAPPKRNGGDLGSAIYGMLVLGLVLPVPMMAITFFVFGLSRDRFWPAFTALMLLSTVAFGVIRYARFLLDGPRHAGELEKWNREWFCNRCGSRFSE